MVDPISNTINQSKWIYYQRNITKNIEIFLQHDMINTDLLTCHIVSSGNAAIKPFQHIFLINYNIKVSPQYWVFGSYSYDKVMHVTHKLMH